MSIIRLICCNRTLDQLPVHVQQRIVLTTTFPPDYLGLALSCSVSIEQANKTQPFLLHKCPPIFHQLTLVSGTLPQPMWTLSALTRPRLRRSTGNRMLSRTHAMTLTSIVLRLGITLTRFGFIEQPPILTLCL